MRHPQSTVVQGIIPAGGRLLWCRPASGRGSTSAIAADVPPSQCPPSRVGRCSLAPDRPIGCHQVNAAALPCADQMAISTGCGESSWRIELK